MQRVVSFDFIWVFIYFVFFGQGFFFFFSVLSSFPVNFDFFF